MKTSINNFSLICLEQNGNTHYDYNGSLKLNFDHYRKVMEAKMQKEFTLPKAERNLSLLKEGDYVYIRTSNNFSSFNRPLYGLIEKDVDGRLFIMSFKLVTWTTKPIEGHSFIPEKIYL